MRSRVVTLLSDFGTKDPFVGVMKGVISSRFPEATIVDLAHGVSAQDVVEGAFWLEHCFRWFPPGTVHVAVVDPGVGSERAAVAVSAHGHFFVAPDNGLVAAVAEGGRVRAIDPGALGLPEPSRTFHGRDVFAPAAAEIARGRPFESIGPAFELRVGPPLPRARLENGRAHGVVVTIDHFGNAITNIPRHMALEADEAFAGGRTIGVFGTYSDVAQGELLALWSSFDTLEIACRDGDAAALLGLRRGSMVSVAAASTPGS